MDQRKLERKTLAAADAAAATREYYAERDAQIDRIAKLKAARKARDDAEVPPAAPPAKAKRRSTKRAG